MNDPTIAVSNGDLRREIVLADLAHRAALTLREQRAALRLGLYVVDGHEQDVGDEDDGER